MDQTTVDRIIAVSDNVIPFPIARREPPRPIWAETGLYDLEMMEAYWADMAEQFG